MLAVHCWCCLENRTSLQCTMHTDYQTSFPSVDTECINCRRHVSSPLAISDIIALTLWLSDLSRASAHLSKKCPIISVVLTLKDWVRGLWARTGGLGSCSGSVGLGSALQIILSKSAHMNAAPGKTDMQGGSKGSGD